MYTLQFEQSQPLLPSLVFRLAVETYIAKVTQAQKNSYLQLTQQPSSAAKPAADMSADELRVAVKRQTLGLRALQQQLAVLEPTPAFSLLTLWRLVRVMLSTAAKGVVTTTSATVSLHRSALFLVCFLVVHLAGNLAVFAGRDVFNSYGHKLRSNPLLTVVEYYLLLASVVHAATAFLATYRKRRSIAKKPLSQGKLLLSSLVVVAFVCTHLLDFRFSDASPDSSSVRDLFGEQLELFRSPFKVVWYLAGVAAVGLHLWFGWSKTVRRMDQVPKEWQPASALSLSLSLWLCGARTTAPSFSLPSSH